MDLDLVGGFLVLGAQVLSWVLEVEVQELILGLHGFRV